MIRLQPALPPGYRLVCCDSIGSTNDEAKRLARDGAAEGTFAWALEQTAGRGRRGRAWVSPRGNLYASLIVRPDCPAYQAAQLGFVAALAIGDALGGMLPRLAGLAYKWPNDVLVNGRKIAGILLESETAALDKLAFLVVGIGSTSKLHHTTRSFRLHRPPKSFSARSRRRRCWRRSPVISKRGKSAGKQMGSRRCAPTAVSLTTYDGGPEDFMLTPLAELVEQLASGRLHVQVARTFHLDEIVEAHRPSENRGEHNVAKH